MQSSWLQAPFPWIFANLGASFLYTHLSSFILEKKKCLPLPFFGSSTSCLSKSSHQSPSFCGNLASSRASLHLINLSINLVKPYQRRSSAAHQRGGAAAVQRQTSTGQSFCPQRSSTLSRERQPRKQTISVNWASLHMCFPRGIRGKEPACQCRRHKRHGFNPLEEGMATHSSILA